MKTYLVGGAVRDLLLDRPIKDRDYVVVGGTVRQMLSQGFTPVGKDFPVFLHPKTKDEYALARCERKVAKGYTGFEFVTDTSVTLEDDLSRRDLTVNAMAMDESGNLIDPYGGQEDLANKTLRHVSAAFVEDPLRILRVARFAARYHQAGFTIAPETKQLMRAMIERGELHELSAPRVTQEMHSVLQEDQAWVFFQVLEDLGGMTPWFAELQGQIDTGPMRTITSISRHQAVRYTCLCSCLSTAELAGLSTRLLVSGDCRDLSALFIAHAAPMLHNEPAQGRELLTVLENVDAFRRKNRFDLFLLIVQASLLTQYTESVVMPIMQYYRQCFQAAFEVDVQNIIQRGFVGAEIRQELFKLRVARLEKLKF